MITRVHIGDVPGFLFIISEKKPPEIIKNNIIEELYLLKCCLF